MHLLLVFKLKFMKISNTQLTQKIGSTDLFIEYAVPTE